MGNFRGILAVLVTLTLGQSLWADGGPKSKIGRQGNFEVKQLVTIDFEELSPKRRIFAYYISMAIQAGRDIYWQQKTADGLAIRTMLEGIYEFAGSFSEAERLALEEYMAEFYLNSGIYDKWSGQKFQHDFKYLSLSEPNLLDMALRADSLYEAKYGEFADFAGQARKFRREMFDPDYKRYYKTEGQEGLDPIADSGTNFYGPGVTEADVLSLPEEIQKHVLSYIYKEGDEIRYTTNSLGGRFDTELRMVDHYLALAYEWATESERAVIDAERKLIRSGSTEDFKNSEIVWVQHHGEDMDFRLGFIEVYEDPLAIRAAWEGEIHMPRTDPTTKARVKAIRDNAFYFEQNMPVTDEYKKPAGFTPPQAEATNFLYMGGELDVGGVGGINLPNNPQVREEYGSKSVSASNIMNDIGDDSTKDQSVLDRRYLPRYHDLARSVEAPTIGDMKVEFHEILGHGSGRLNDGVDEEALKELHPPIEEMRAELAALFHFTDYLKLRELEILPGDLTDEQAKASAQFAILDFFTGQIWSYIRLPEEQQAINQAHMWARQTMLNWLIAKEQLAVVLGDDGVPYIDLTGDIEGLRQALGELWFNNQYIKSTGDFDAAAQLLEAFGGYSDENRQWRAAMKARMQADGVPEKRLILNPLMVPVRSFGGQDGDGDLIDVEMIYEEAGQENPLRSFILRQMQVSQQNARLREHITRGGLGKVLGNFTEIVQEMAVVKQLALELGKGIEQAAQEFKKSCTRLLNPDKD